MHVHVHVQGKNTCTSHVHWTFKYLLHNQFDQFDKCIHDALLHEHVQVCVWYIVGCWTDHSYYPVINVTCSFLLLVHMFWLT